MYRDPGDSTKIMKPKQESRFLIKKVEATERLGDGPYAYVSCESSGHFEVICDHCKVVVGSLVSNSHREFYLVHLGENWRKHKSHYSWNSKEEGCYSVQYCWPCTEVLELAPLI